LDFVRYANMLQGNYAESARAAQRGAESVGPDARTVNRGQKRVVHAWVVDKIFGQWETLLNAEPSHSGTPYLDGMWSYVIGSAYAATDQVPQAERELENIRRQASNDTVDATGVNPTPASHILSLAGFALEGEIKEALGDLDGAIDAYRQAVQLEDNNNYTEPPDWSQSMRLYLGAALLDAGRPVDAEAVFRRDLEWNQQSGWATYGLYQALLAQERAVEAAIVNRQFQSLWRNADVVLERSRL
jgi:tetratricopeptide (TPR) repeat protein